MMLSGTWPIAQGSDWSPSLLANGLDLWSVDLAVPPAQASRCEALLDDDERARAGRFMHSRDRLRYLVAHAALRHLLARYAGLPAHAIRYAFGPQGKPALAAPIVSFNLSHAGELALVAVTRHARVGVDVEEIRHLDDAMSIARSFFAPGEEAALAALPERERDVGFFRCWTRKEAVVKAIGTGLSSSLRDFEVDISRESAAVLRHSGDPAFSKPWTMIPFEPRAGYVGAAAVAGTVGRITCRAFALDG